MWIRMFIMLLNNFPPLSPCPSYFPRRFTTTFPALPSLPPPPPPAPLHSLPHPRPCPSHSQMKEVMQALEELAMSYDHKDREIEVACQERDQLRVDLETLKVGPSRLHELLGLRDSGTCLRTVLDNYLQ